MQWSNASRSGGAFCFIINHNFSDNERSGPIITINYRRYFMDGISNLGKDEKDLVVSRWLDRDVELSISFVINAFRFVAVLFTWSLLWNTNCTVNLTYDCLFYHW